MEKVDTYGVTVFSPDSSAIVLEAGMCAYSHENSMFIRFLWLKHKTY
jgi:hypothetical protein